MYMSERKAAQQRPSRLRNDIPAGCHTTHDVQQPSSNFPCAWCRPSPLHMPRMDILSYATTVHQDLACARAERVLLHRGPILSDVGTASDLCMLDAATLCCHSGFSSASAKGWLKPLRHPEAPAFIDRSHASSRSVFRTLISCKLHGLEAQREAPTRHQEAFRTCWLFMN